MRKLAGKKTNKSRMPSEEMFTYSAIPPHTPAIERSVADFRSVRCIEKAPYELICKFYHMSVEKAHQFNWRAFDLF